MLLILFAADTNAFIWSSLAKPYNKLWDLVRCSFQTAGLRNLNFYLVLRINSGEHFGIFSRSKSKWHQRCSKIEIASKGKLRV